MGKKCVQLVGGLRTYLGISSAYPQPGSLAPATSEQLYGLCISYRHFIRRQLDVAHLCNTSQLYHFSPRPTITTICTLFKNQPTKGFLCA